MDKQLATPVESAQAKLAKFEADITEFLNGDRMVAASTFGDDFIEYRNLVKLTKDPDTHLKYLRFVHEVAWPNVKQKDQAPQLPVVHFNIIRRQPKATEVVTIDSDTQLVEQYPQLDEITITVDAATIAVINADLDEL